MLKSVRHEQTGIYKCEVSADAPEFETDVVSAQMTVVGKWILGSWYPDHYHLLSYIHYNQTSLY